MQFDRRKAVALLAYVALAERPPSRDELATLFWPESDQARARGALRQTLSTLVAAVGDSVFEIGRETVALRPTPDLWVDAAEFLRLVRQTAPDAIAQSEQAARAAGLYAGAFMGGFTLPDAPDFDRWQARTADALLGAYAALCERAAGNHLSEKRPEDAIVFCRHWLGADATDEAAHRLLMQALAASGQRGAALRQFQECAEVLQRELGVSPSDETLQVRQRIAAGHAERAPEPATVRHAPAAVIEVPRHNLPRQITSFVGRTNELRDLDALLVGEPDSRLVTLVGPGGMGKTRLALQAASTCIGKFDHGVVFVPLASLESAAFLPEAIADALGFVFYNQSNPRKQLLGYLRNKRLLLVLDNFEHLLSGTPMLSEMLTEAPELKILVTCRERLHVQAEWIVDVEGLKFPEYGDEAPQDLRAYPAIRLFEQRARQVSTKFSLEREMQHVIEIARHTNGMPLALEMAAAWTRVLSPGEILAEITRNLDFLRHGANDVPERHRSVRAIFEQSWSFLAPYDQLALAKLAVFRGGCTLAAAQAIANATPSMLATFADRALLQAKLDGRFEMHELLRQFLLGQLAKLDALEVTSQHHAAWFADSLNTFSKALDSSREATAIQELTVDYDNCRAAWIWSCQHDEHPLPARSASGMAGFLMRRTRYSEARQLMQLAVSATDAADSASPEAKQTRALCQINLGIASYRLSQISEAEQHLISGIQQARVFGFANEIIAGQCVLGESQVMRGQIDTGLLTLEEAVNTARKTGEFATLAHALNFLGFAEHLAGRSAQAEAHLNESLALWRTQPNEWSMARVLNNLGLVNMELGHYTVARRMFGECYETWRGLNAHGMTAFALNNLGAVAILEGSNEDAIRTLERALALGREVGSRIGQAHSLFNLAAAASNLGQFDSARSHWQAAREIFTEAQAIDSVARCHAHLGYLASRARNNAEARTELLDALQLCAQNGLQSTAEALMFAAGHLISQQATHDEGLTLMGFVLGTPGISQSTIDDAVQILRAHGCTAELANKSAPGRDVSQVQILARAMQLLRST